MTTEKVKYGVHSEAGKLRKVMVCSPGLAHQRLTPNNCDELLFDDVLWVAQAKRDHFDFVTKMRERDIDVLEMHNLLTDIVTIPEALDWILERKITANTVGLGLIDEVSAWLRSLEPRKISEFLIGGVSADDLPNSFGGKTIEMFRDFLGHASFILPPLPNTQFTRDTTCWIYGGVTLNPMYWPARRQETLLASAIYKFHPEFTNADFQIWYGDPDQEHGAATLEGGDVMPIGNGVVLIGMGERSSHQAIGQLARNLFKNNAVERVIVAGLPKSRAAMHLDTVFSFCDRDLVTIFPEVVNQIIPFTLRPDDSKPTASISNGRKPTSSKPSPQRSTSRRCVWSRPAATASPPSASSGMTATTWWPWSLAW
jgi:arginine deiminase